MSVGPLIHLTSRLAQWLGRDHRVEPQGPTLSQEDHAVASECSAKDVCSYHLQRGIGSLRESVLARVADPTSWIGGGVHSRSHHPGTLGTTVLGQSSQWRGWPHTGPIQASQSDRVVGANLHPSQPLGLSGRARNRTLARAVRLTDCDDRTRGEDLRCCTWGCPGPASDRSPISTSRIAGVRSNGSHLVFEASSSKPLKQTRSSP